MMRSLILVLGVALCGAASAQTPSQAYPVKPVRLVVPFAPGASTDLLSRLAADELSKRLGRTFVVENVTGAGGTIGTAQVAKANPDGYTLLAGSPGPITISPVAQKNLSYHIQDLQPITMIAEGPGVLVVHRDSRFKSVEDLLSAAKAKPGSLTFGSAGTGSFSHLNGELLKALGGVDIVHVPYRGSGPALIDMIGGRLDLYIEYFPAVQKFVQSGELRALAVTSARRFALRPELPTMIEESVPGYDASAWVGLMTPAGTPREIVDRIQQELAKALREPAITQRLQSLGVLAGGQSPAEFSAFLFREREKIKKLVDATGLTINPQ
jgi:tripartite-type tricarboxylate transporter receptor subunit TctC